MFGGGTGMGGGGGGGGGSMLRVIGRAVTTRTGVTNLQETISSSSSSPSSNTTVTSPTAQARPTQKPDNWSLSSCSSGSPFTAPVSATHWPSLAASPGSFCDEYEWVCVDGSDQERPQAPFAYDFVLGPGPSVEEVHSAVSALTHAFDTASHYQLIRDKFAYDVDKDNADQISSPTGFLHKVSSVGSELDWMEPSLHLCNPGMLHPFGPQRVYDAFHLLQTEPSVQRMVMSLSSDRAVWDAVMNNEVVRDLRETYYADENMSATNSVSSEECGADSNPAMNVVRWIFDNTKAKVMEVFEKITNLVNELFKPADDEKTTAGPKDPFQEKLRTSFLLSIMVLLIVVVTRGHRA